MQSVGFCNGRPSKQVYKYSERIFTVKVLKTQRKTPRPHLRIVQERTTVENDNVYTVPWG